MIFIFLEETLEPELGTFVLQFFLLMFVRNRRRRKDKKFTNFSKLWMMNKGNWWFFSSKKMLFCEFGRFWNEREREKFSGRKRDVLKNETVEEHFGQFGGFFFLNKWKLFFGPGFFLMVCIVSRCKFILYHLSIKMV
jgi:hypothetical protein